MTSLKDLEPWTAASDEPDPRDIIDPRYIDYRVVADLIEWCPGFGDKQAVRHVAQDDPVEPYVRFDMTVNWNQAMADLAPKLKFYLRKELNGLEYLIDTNVRDVPQLPMNGWKVVEWKVVKGLNAGGKPVTHDFVSWEKNTLSGLIKAQSMYSWHSYRRGAIRPEKRYA